MNGEQLKNSILQMAVCGKLVPQDPNDEPASVLIDRIREEKERLIKEGKIKREKNPSRIFRGADNLPYEQIGDNEPVCIADEVPFEIPESWEWVRMSSVMTFYNGRAYKKTELLDKGKYQVLRVGNLFTNNNWYYSDLELEEDKYCSKNDLLYAWSASFGPFIWNGPKCIYHYHIWKITHSDMLLKEYLYFYLLADTVSIKAAGHGVSMMHMTKDGMEKRLIALPPLTEQHRIVDKIKQVFPLVNDYESVERNLITLNSQIPELLKKSILQWAVQGKLVPQNPNDEPASVLLERIRKEKQRLIAEGKIKKDKNESVIFRRDNSHYEKLNGIERCIDDEIPFDIPENWCWCRLGNISTYAQIKKKIKVNEADKSIWGLDLEDIEKGGKLLSKKSLGDRKSNGDKTIFSKGDILYSKLRPYLLKIIIASDDGICTSEIVPFKLYGNIISEYIVAFLKSPYIDNFINGITYGVKMPRVGTDTMINLLVPLPPLNEQYRIVNQLNTVLPLCEKL